MSASPVPIPAFPFQFVVDAGSVHPFTGKPAASRTSEIFPGMGLRDYFAIHASEQDVIRQGEVIRSAQVASGGMGILPDGWQIAARYMHADAMLKAREQKGGAA